MNCCGQDGSLLLAPCMLRECAQPALGGWGRTGPSMPVLSGSAMLAGGGGGRRLLGSPEPLPSLPLDDPSAPGPSPVGSCALQHVAHLLWAASPLPWEVSRVHSQVGFVVFSNVRPEHMAGTYAGSGGIPCLRLPRGFPVQPGDVLCVCSFTSDT